jgi:hypothetical protein
MKSAILSLLAGLIGVGLAAAGPAGKVLILNNDLLIEGEIRQEGDCFIVRRGMGETIIPAAKVIELVADREQAYRVMSARCNRRDFDERVRLAHWCLENNLREQALKEAEQLLQFRPTDEKLQRLVEGLRIKKAPPAPVPANHSATAFDQAIELERPDFNRESFGTFVAKVQPILMNACVSCHTAGQGGNFSLLRVVGGSTPKASLFNLTSTLKQLNRADLAASPFLVKAITAHGKSVRPPLRDQQAPAYQNLEAWVRMAVVPEEAAPPPAVLIAGPAVAAEAKPVLQTSFGETVAKPAIAPETKPILQTSFGEAVAKPTIASEVKPSPKIAFGETSTSQTKPEPQTEPKDPFDPVIFNGAIQPKK